jgi:hypothetical protein
MVARSLEMRCEPTAAPPLPFFAAVPAADIRKAIHELNPDEDFPWETWDQ